MTRLALMRHGHTPWNREGRIQGRSDIPLDDDARVDLGRLDLPTPWDQADLWSSPLMRASETAELVASRTPQTTPALTEMNWGQWEGKHGAVLRAAPQNDYRDIEDWGWDYTPPSGESPRAMATRLQPWLDDIRSDTVAVCHIGVMRVILAQAWDWNFAGPCPFTIKRNRLYVLSRTATGWTPDPDPVRLKDKTL
ncbi:MAG: histidine phosphatase family protein [Aliishimia sp.]